MEPIIKMLLLFFISFLIPSAAYSDYFWYISDIHYDPTYNKSSDSCIEGAKVEALGQYGSFDCDAPWKLASSAMNAMRMNGGAAQFIVWAGDNPPHVREQEMLSTEKVLSISQKLTDQLKEEFPLTPVYPLLGNHDYYPKNQLPGETNEVYEKLTTMWESWINSGGRNPECLVTFRKGGYYTKIMVELDNKIRSLILNTNLYSGSDEATEGVEDPAGQFEWMEDVLEKAKNEGERVHIFLHIPPDMGIRSKQNVKFASILENYSSIILGIYAGHYHYDSFRIFSDEDGTPFSSMLISPSVTPWKGSYEDAVPHNPAIRKYIFDRHEFDLQDYEQYYLDLDLANKGNVEWQKLYTFTKAYAVTSVSSNNLKKVKESFEQFASESFHKYYDRKYVSIRSGYVPCGCECKKKEVCSIATTNEDAYDKCLENEDCGGYIGKGDQNTVHFSTFFLVISLSFLFRSTYKH